MSRVLAIDTAGPVLGVALLHQGRIQHTSDSDGPLRHVEHIVPRIQAALAEVGWPLYSVDAVAVSAGPGSFTGLRIGMAAAKAIALAGGIPVVSVDTLMAVAATEQYRQEVTWPPSAPARPSTIVPVLDARKQRFYAAAFRNNASLDRLSEDGDLTHDGVRRLIRTVPSSEDCSWCAPGPMGEQFQTEPGYMPAAVQTDSAAAGTALLGDRLLCRGTSDDSYQGPFYLRSGDIGVRASAPRFAPNQDTH